MEVRTAGVEMVSVSSALTRAVPLVGVVVEALSRRHHDRRVEMQGWFGWSWTKP
jgi:hypothetical protein